MRSLRIFMTAAVLVLLAGSAASAQSLGDLARQERARRADQPPRATRVLTNEDLQRDRILEPRTPAAPAVTAQDELPAIPALPPSENVVPLWTAAPQVNIAPSPEPTQVTLGDFARQVRAERTARKRTREILAAREQQQKPVLASAPAPPAPAPSPRRERIVAVTPPRPVTRPVTRRARRRAAPRLMLASAPSADAVVVNRGDSLWKIAQRELGDGSLWTALWQANPEIADPNLIYPGQALRRPAAEQIAQAKTPAAPAVFRAAQSKTSARTSFAAQVLAGSVRKATVRANGEVPRVTTERPAPAHRSGPHYAPR